MADSCCSEFWYNHVKNEHNNHLKDQNSPYLLQHAENPVDWYPWCKEAFDLAKSEDKPVFLSIGYSTCHWCHVMAHESFEDRQIAEILNRYYISIKVDREERPDLDAIYMSVCQAFTGSGGWPMSVFLTPEQKPFFAGTYFPKTGRFGQVGFQELLMLVQEKWAHDRRSLLDSAEELVSALKQEDKGQLHTGKELDFALIQRAVSIFTRLYDEECGGFGQAPKFPTAHNLLFLMRQYEKNGNGNPWEMAELDFWMITLMLRLV